MSGNTPVAGLPLARMRVVRRVRGALALATLLLSGGLWAGQPVTALQTVPRPATPSAYLGPDGVTYRFGTGQDRVITTITVPLDGAPVALAPHRTVEDVAVHRVEANLTGVNAAGVHGPRLRFEYEGGRDGDTVRLSGPQLHSLADVFRGLSVTAADTDLFCNSGPRANNVERVDVITRSGIVAPLDPAELRRAGFLVTERLGNNYYHLAAITRLDADGNPAAFGRLVAGVPAGYGPRLYKPAPGLRWLATPADSRAPGLLPVEYSHLDSQGVHGQFHTLAELGLAPGQRFYGFALFPGDVTPDMDLLGLSDVPLDTSDGDGDCGDHYGGGAAIFTTPGQTPGRIGGRLWEDSDGDGRPDGGERGLAGVPVELHPDRDGDGRPDAADAVLAVARTDGEGRYHFAHVFPGQFLVVVPDGAVPAGLRLSAGRNPHPVALPAGGARLDVNFGYRPAAIRLGAAKRVLASERTAPGEYRLTLAFVLANLGPRDAPNVQLTDDLAAALPGVSDFRVLAPPAVSGALSRVNPAYDGRGDTRLLAGDETLPAGARAELTLRLAVSVGDAPGPFLNQAHLTSASVPGGAPLAEDRSDDGSEPDPNGNGRADDPGEDDPTPLPLAVAVLGESGVRLELTKSVDRSEARVGDLLRYTLRLHNPAGQAVSGVQLDDDTPDGFRYVAGSAALLRPGPDGRFDTADDQAEALAPALTAAGDLRFTGLTLAAHERVRLTYLLRVGSGVPDGEHRNVAVLVDPDGAALSGRSVARVHVRRDPLLSDSTVIGKVFHDRDGDGVQDPADATGLRLSGPAFGKQPLALQDLPGRRSEQDPPATLRLPVPEGAFTLTSREGGVLRVDARDRVRAAHRGARARGLTGQDLELTIERRDGRRWAVIANRGIQEEGLPGVRLATVDGLLVETDLYGRFHIADVDTGRPDRSALFILKVDPASLPQGAEFTTGNPRVLRLGRALMTRMDFGVRLPPAPPARAQVERTVRVPQTRTVKLTGRYPPVHFDSGRDELRPDALALLETVSAELAGKQAVRLSLVGHTDSQRLKPSTAARFGDNYGLGLARARRVGEYLARRVPGAAIRTASRGATEPVASNATPEGMARNRRVEIDGSYRETRLVARQVRETVRLPHGGEIRASEDPARPQPRLAVAALGPLVVDGQGRVVRPARFLLAANYGAFIRRWTLAIYRAGDLSPARPVAELGGSGLPAPDRPPEWDGRVRHGAPLAPGDVLRVVLRVYDDAGHVDETSPQPLAVLGAKAARDLPDPLRDRAALLRRAAALADVSQLARQTIPIRGSRVRLFGHDIDPDLRLRIDGRPVLLDEAGRFATEALLPVGRHRFRVALTDREGRTWRRELAVDVSGKYFFMVALGSLTLGKNQVGGHIEPVAAADSHYNGDLFVDGRGAFYLKGRIKGKYLLTAQLDSGEGKLNRLGERLRAKRPERLFRQLDPDRYYPVYGDDSTTTSDVNSQGPLYLRLDWDHDRLLWGDFHTGFTGNELAWYDRSLYGAQFVHRSNDLTAAGDHRTELAGFASEAQTALAHDEFLATGGSLYYLRRTGISEGSDKVWVEVRDPASERVVETRVLRRGTDYEIDYLQGRLLLRRPLSAWAVRGDALITERPGEAGRVLLMVDYEYRPDAAFEAGRLTSGLQGRHWLGEHVAVGGTLVREARGAGGADYRLQGLDLTLRHSDGTWLRAELADSEATQSRAAWRSADGGLSFGRLQDGTADDRSGRAWSLRGALDLADFTDERLQGHIEAWWQDRDAGFSSARADDGSATEDRGIAAHWSPAEGLTLTARATHLKKEKDGAVTARDSSALAAEWQAGRRLTLRAELRHERSEQTRADNRFEAAHVATTAEVDPAGQGGTGTATLGAVGITYRAGEDTELYGQVQQVLRDDGRYAPNDRVTAGVRHTVNERLSLHGELSDGDRGQAATAGVEYRASDDLALQLEAGVGAAPSRLGARLTTGGGTELYGSYAVDPDRTDGPSRTLTLGERRDLATGMRLFSEQQFTEEAGQAGVGHVFGVEHSVGRALTVSARLGHHRLARAGGGEVARDTHSLGLQYRRDGLRAATRLEYRRDHASDAGGDTVDQHQWLSSNALEWQQNPHLRWLIRLNLSLTDDDLADRTAARFVEGSAGFAWRPAFSDRLDVLGKYSYLDDLASAGQATTRPDERAHVLSLETLYDLTRHWELGGKLAWRRGELRQRRDGGPWFDSGARLAVLRTRYRVDGYWDALAEYRWLRVTDNDDTRHGALAAVYYHLGRHMKVGVGYNFTEFDDDLTRLDWDSRGWFVDLVGKF